MEFTLYEKEASSVGLTDRLKVLIGPIHAPDFGVIVIIEVIVLFVEFVPIKELMLPFPDDFNPIKVFELLQLYSVPMVPVNLISVKLIPEQTVWSGMLLTEGELLILTFARAVSPHVPDVI
jgi:hypothetical protein